MTAKNIAGQKFHSLTVVERVENVRGAAAWRCRCECGAERIARGIDLRSGSIKSCGCTMRARLRELRTTHGMSRSPEWTCWESMLRRCSDPRVKFYRRYGGRGIKVCDRWRDFANFFADMGPRPSPKHSIERNDTNGNYEPGNCRWATPIEQQNNRSDNVLLTHNGRTMTLTQWAREVGMAENTLRARIRNGWPTGAALTRPAVPRAAPGTSPRSRPSAKARLLERIGGGGK